nr:hypothetical protein GCM10020093_108720 [Planobispora longispora]
MPLAVLLSAHLFPYRPLWRALCAQARPGEEEGLRHLGELMFQAIERAVSAVSEAYLGQAALAERGEALRAVARTLLAGQDADDVAARYGVVLEPGYRVLYLAVGPAGDAGDAGDTGDTGDTGETERARDADAAGSAGRSGGSAGSTGLVVEVRRRLHTVQAELDRHVGEPVMSWFGPEGGHALLPLRVPAPAARLARSLADGGVAAHIGTAVAERRADIPAAARRAARIAEVARGGGRPAGLYELRDVLLDYHLSAPGASGAELGGLLDALDPALLETLEAYFAADFDRRSTARALGVHPNTVDNRLSRAGALLGADLRTSGGILLVGAALAARRLRAATGGEAGAR